MRLAIWALGLALLLTGCIHAGPNEEAESAQSSVPRNTEFTWYNSGTSPIDYFTDNATGCMYLVANAKGVTPRMTRAADTNEYVQMGCRTYTPIK